MKPLPKDLRELAMGLYLNGVRPNAIAKQLGVSPNTIQTWRVRGRWVEKQRTLCGELSRADSQMLSAQLAEKSLQVRKVLAEDIEATTAQLPANKPGNLKHFAARQRAMESVVKNAARIFGWDEENSTGDSLVTVDLASVVEVPPPYQEKKACLSPTTSSQDDEAAPSLSTPPRARGHGSENSTQNVDTVEVAIDVLHGTPDGAHSEHHGTGDEVAMPESNEGEDVEEATVEEPEPPPHHGNDPDDESPPVI